MKKYQLGGETLTPLCLITLIFLTILSGALVMRKITMKKLATHATHEVAKPLPPPAE